MDKYALEAPAVSAVEALVRDEPLVAAHSERPMVLDKNSRTAAAKLTAEEEYAVLVGFFFILNIDNHANFSKSDPDLVAANDAERVAWIAYRACRTTPKKQYSNARQSMRSFELATELIVSEDVAAAVCSKPTRH